jgi:hypothetical protein
MMDTHVGSQGRLVVGSKTFSGLLHRAVPELGAYNSGITVRHVPVVTCEFLTVKSPHQQGAGTRSPGPRRES